MCNPASFVLTKDRVFWSKKTDLHAEIIKDFSLCESIRNESPATCESCTLKVEINPPREGAFDAPLNEWVFRVDQDITPKWFDAAADEKRARAALEDWAKSKLVRANESREVLSGEFVICVMASGVVQNVRAFGVVQNVRDSGVVQNVRTYGVVQNVWASGVVQNVWASGVVQNVRDFGVVQNVRDSGVVQNVRASGVVQNVWAYGVVQNLIGGCVLFFNRFSCKITGKLSVAIDMTGDKAKCYVGTDKPRTITNIKKARLAHGRTVTP